MLFKLPSTFHTLELSLLPSHHRHGTDSQPSAMPPPNPRVLQHSPPLGMPRIDLPTLFVLLWLPLQTPSPRAVLGCLPSAAKATCLPPLKGSGPSLPPLGLQSQRPFEVTPATAAVELMTPKCSAQGGKKKMATAM